MRPAPAIEALAGLSFNGVAFAADMAMFDFDPTKPEIIRSGARKGETVFLGSHALRVQCSWRLRRGPCVLANGEGRLVPSVVEPAVGNIVDNAEMTDGTIVLRMGEFRLEISPDNEGDEQWRLLNDDPEADHLVWGD